MENGIRRIPTGVSDFDTMIQGGFPAGSVVLLIGDVGAGQREFAYTSASKLAIVKEDPEMFDFMLGHTCRREDLPEEIFYISFSKAAEDIIGEIKSAFNESFYMALEKQMKFRDFSRAYFKNSIVPVKWSGDGSSLFSKSPTLPLLESLVNFLDENAENSLVIIDSLTDLVISKQVDIIELATLLRGMQRQAKKWGGVIYLLMTKNIVGREKEVLLEDSVDGVLVFEWTHTNRSSSRQRHMYLEEFTSLLPHLEAERIARFNTEINSTSGFVVINTVNV